MTIKVWKVSFGANANSCHIAAKNIDEAISKARKIYKEEAETEPEYYWISGVELEVETDY